MPTETATPTTETKADKTPKMTVGEYKGSPVLTFSEGDGDRYPFSFGAGKGKKILAYIEANGVDSFMAALRKIAE